MDSDTQQDAFFKLHRDLPREGPGEPADVVWATQQAVIGARARIADVGCGPGADIAALLAQAPQGEVTALDKTAQFVRAARAIYADDPRVTVLKADMAAIHNSYDLIWCAGAVYFLGVERALRGWRKSLTPQGCIAFSELCWFGENRPARAQALWADHTAMTDVAGVTRQIDAAGFDVIGQRRLSDAAWEAYLTPLDARIAALRPGADAALTQVLDEAAEEAACWRAHRDAFGYLLSVVRPR
ncbi:class I SAM-dependent methyltransferase [uncultured Sulfitobacter sp.]|uniref:class I SAM-dependent methyltransferase n=1 Tax=uncultured Sulfitobacter sp. TaxID=191468 RepID=UPI0026238C8A|nr:class I SAM-dependent methyltransferase [uncultured Sulfitobacter sp.]